MIELFVVDLEFTDGSIIHNCSIFRENPKTCDIAYGNKKDLIAAFKKEPNKVKYVFFQSELIQGHSCLDNVKSYKIKNI
jgi:hypothetical protein